VKYEEVELVTLEACGQGDRKFGGLR
jgi:hypothetical protein